MGAEERGQHDAIAKSLFVMSGLRVPVVSVVIGEGGSGGALAFGVGNRVLMQEHATYSVITPEGFASILWRDSSRSKEAARTMRVTAQDLLSFNVIDEIITEQLGGDKRDHKAAAELLNRCLPCILINFLILIRTLL